MIHQPESPLDSLRLLVESYGSQRAAAAALGVSAAYIGDIILGQRDISDNMARKLGWLRRPTEWERIRPDTGLAVSADGKIHGDQIGEALAAYDKEHPQERQP